MEKYTVNQSIWIAAAILTYERYYNLKKPTKEDMKLSQNDIVKRAQELCEDEVRSSRVSKYCNGDHVNKSHNYLRDAGDSKRRITAPNEFNGKDERPELNLDSVVSTKKGDIIIQQLIKFLENEYKDLIFDSEKVNSIDCLGILKYLEENSGKEYKAIDKVEGDEKTKYINLKNKGSSAVNELDKIAELCETRFELEKEGQSQWLDGSRTKIRDYLWRRLKFPEYKDCKTSISLVVELEESQKARFRICIEMEDSGSELPDYKKHHKILNKDIKEGDDLVYILCGDNANSPKIQINEDTAAVKEKVESGTYKKIQVAHLISQREIEQKHKTNEDIVNEILDSVEQLLEYYKLVVDENNNDLIHKSIKNSLSKGDEKMNKNIILYGPPGTGKTYNSVNYAVAIIENKKVEDVKKENYKDVFERYKNYKDRGQISFTTFHQSYSYEEFIEGLKPVIDNNSDESENNSIKYSIESGIFKEICERASAVTAEIDDSLSIDYNSTVWKISLYGARENKIKTECFKDEVIRIGWDNDNESDDDEYIKQYGSGDQGTIKTFKNEMKKGDIVLSLYDQKNIDGIGIIIGDYEYGKYDEYKRYRKVKWLVKNKKIYIYDLNGNVNLTLKAVYELFRITPTKVMELVNKINKNEVQKEITNIKKNDNNYVLIIDEINRGNISKIFGELITLIEESKRLGADEEAETILPYSKIPFGVPNNVYIIGTMNTADRSIAVMDTALRRRFNFIEMMPNADILKDVKIDDIDVLKMLKVINRRIECLYDREHTIGHAYFIPLIKDPTIDMLAQIFKNKIIPLLQEYFYEDYSKIQLVLGDNVKSDEKYKFIKDEEIDVSKVFKGNVNIDLEERKYSINTEAFGEIESYKEIY